MFLNSLKIWVQTHIHDIVIVVLICLIAGIPRMIDLGTFLTADEKTWIGRSYEYIRAFKDFRFNDMLQTTHPGATTLWLSGIAVTITMFSKHVLFTPENLLHFITPAQVSIAVVNTLIVGVVYVFLLALFRNRKIAILASLFMALDPIIIGYSRVVHVDALVGGFMLLAALAMCIYVDRAYSKKWLIISAVCSALALLTKIPAIFLFPFFILVLLVTGYQSLKNRQWRWQRIKDFLLWLAIIIILFLIIWPVFMVVPDPKGNVLTVKRDVVIAASTPHNMTESYSLNASHYIFTVLTRVNPVIQILSIIGVVVLFRKINPYKKYTWLFVAYCGFFLLMMTLGAKKGDRYILPVFPVLCIISALAVEQFQNKLFRKGVAVLAVLILSITVYQYHPYAVAYSNPFFADNLSQELGWGEGLEQVGAWLNEHAPAAHVASWYPEELAAYTNAPVAHINAHEQNNIRYIVLYRNMFGRSPDHPANNFIDEYYKKRKPVFVAYVHNKEFAWVYEKMAFETNEGELLPGRVVQQVVTPQAQSLAGIDIFFATYSGRAQSGTVVVSLFEEKSLTPLHTWTMPVKNLEDTAWQTLLLPETKVITKPLQVKIEAQGTSPKNAPTVRSTRVYVQQQKRSVAVRLRYVVDSQPLTEEDTNKL